MAAREDLEPTLEERTAEAPPAEAGEDEHAAGAEPEVASLEDAADEPTPAPLAEFEGLVKNYGDHRALGPVTLTLERGCIGLLGPNGAGKSTLIRTMMGLLEPSDGRVRVLGREVGSGARELRQRIGYVPEGPARFPGLTGAEAVILAGRLVGMQKADAVQRAHQVLDYVGLGEARYRPADTYSTGMRQRLKIAQALVHDPELLILDEPTEGVDPEAREEILGLVSELEREHGLQLILSTHLLHDVERVATHVLILNHGQVVQHGTIEELRNRSTRGYQVRCAGHPDALVARLQEEGIEHEWVAPDLRIRLDDPRRILRLADEAGLVVRHLAPVQISLNEAFEEALARGEDALAQLWSARESDGDGAADPTAATPAPVASNGATTDAPHHEKEDH